MEPPFALKQTLHKMLETSFLFFETLGHIDMITCMPFFFFTPESPILPHVQDVLLDLDLVTGNQTEKH